MKGFRQRLSRAKDGNKSSKKKDSSSGTASPSQGASSPANVTPSSSQTQLADARKTAPSADGQPSSGSLQSGQHGAPGAAGGAMFGGPGGMTGGAAAGAAGAGTPHRMGQSLVPNVTISPSAPHIPPPGAAETMPGDLAPPKAGQKSTVFDRLQATPKDNIEGIRTPSDSTLRDLTSLTSVSASWRSCRASMRCHRTRGRSFSCRRSISAISFSTSTMLAEI